MKIDELLKDLETKSSAFRPGMFWFWNDELNMDELRRKIGDFARAGFTRIVIHPNHGMTLEYLSEEYCLRVKAALECCLKYGIKVWLYDEFGWPSGNAGGLLLRTHPEYRAWHLWFGRDAQGDVVAEPRLTERVLDCVTGAPWCRNESGYLDTLSGEAVGKFIELTHQRLYEYIGNALFAKTVEGFFTDEVACMLESTGKNGVWTAECLPWTPEFPAFFKARFGYDVAENYAILADPVQALRQRRDYWQLAQELHVNAFYRAIADWCDRHQVKFTGHLGDDYPAQQVRFSGNPFLALSQMHIPGWDYLGNDRPVEYLVQQMTVVASAAKAAGRKYCFCEAFGVSPQNLTPEKILRKGAFFGLHGINMIYFMGARQSAKGLRKHLYWPAFFDDSPYFEALPALSKALARALALTSHVKRETRYAILYPQDHLEQLPVLDYSPVRQDEHVNLVIDKALKHIRSAGHNCDFVFKETVNKALMSRYERVFVLDEFDYYTDTLTRIDNYENCSLINCDELKDLVQKSAPEFCKYLVSENIADFRYYLYPLADGALVAVFNPRQESASVLIRPKRNYHASYYNLTDGKLYAFEGELSLSGEGVGFLLVHQDMLAAESFFGCKKIEPELKIEIQAPDNTAPLQNVMFSQGKSARSVPGETKPTAMPGHCLPESFFGSGHAAFKGSFSNLTETGGLALVFEKDYISKLCIDERELKISDAKPILLWDQKCHQIDLGLLSAGKHEVSGVMSIPVFESSMKNDGFFEKPPMPSLDLCLYGKFAGDAAAIKPAAETSQGQLPINLRELGFGRCFRKAVIRVELSAAENFTTLKFELFEHTTLKVTVDDHDEHWLLTEPYLLHGKFSGKRCRLRLELFPTAGHLFSPAVLDWGIKSITAIR